MHLHNACWLRVKGAAKPPPTSLFILLVNMRHAGGAAVDGGGSLWRRVLLPLFLRFWFGVMLFYSCVLFLPVWLYAVVD